MAETSTTQAVRRLTSRAQSLIPVLRQRERAAENARCIQPETIQDLREAGVFRLLQPIGYGGYGAELVDFLAVAHEIGRGSGAAAWLYGNFALHSWIIGMFPDQAQQDVWGADGNSIVSSCLRPAGSAERAEGGYELRGRWPYVSGCDHTGWSIVGALLKSPTGPPIPHFFLVPKADYAIVDNWDVNGLAATGSKDLVIEAAFVREHRALPVALTNSGTPPGLQVHESPIYRIPLFSSFSFFLSGPLVGMAQGAIDQYVTQVTNRTTAGGTAGGGEAMSELPTVQLRVGEAQMRVDAARGVLDQAAGNTMAQALTNRTLEPAQRIQNRRAQCFATRLAMETVDVLYESTGAGGIFLSDPIQRIWRDVHVGAKHFSLNWDAIRIMCGQHALGIEPKLKMF